MRRIFGVPSPRLELGSSELLPFLRWPLTLGPAEIAQHKHIIGTTGVGKSKLLSSMFVQLHLQGIGCALIDPHADLAADCLAALLDRGYFQDPQVYTRLLYIDFSRRDRFLPFNVLRQPYDPHTIARNIAEICKRAWPALADGAAPTFENILLHSVVVLAQNELPLTALPQLLTDRPYRERLLRQVGDPHVRYFFRERYDQWGREAPLMRESTLNRVALLTFSPVLRFSLGQRENLLDFRSLIDRGVSVIYNLGGLDEESQRFLGALIAHGYEVAALSRAELPEGERRQAHLIMDEFSMFSAQSEEALSRVLSLARKYGLFLTLAHQTFSQLSGRLAGALQNTVSIAFKLGRSDAEWAARRFGRFEESAIRHEVEDPAALERTHPVYWGLSETFERWTKALEDLRPREAFVKLRGKTVKIRTRHMPRPRCMPEQLHELMQHYGEALMTPAQQAIDLVDAVVSPTQVPPRVRRVPLG